MLGLGNEINISKFWDFHFNFHKSQAEPLTIKK